MVDYLSTAGAGWPGMLKDSEIELSFFRKTVNVKLRLSKQKLSSDAEEVLRSSNLQLA